MLMCGNKKNGQKVELNNHTSFPHPEKYGQHGFSHIGWNNYLASTKNELYDVVSQQSGTAGAASQANTKAQISSSSCPCNKLGGYCGCEARLGLHGDHEKDIYGENLYAPYGYEDYEGMGGKSSAGITAVENDLWPVSTAVPHSATYKRRENDLWASVQPDRNTIYHAYEKQLF